MDFAEQNDTDTWVADYEVLKGFALIGERMTLKKFVANEDLRQGLLTVDEIGKRMKNPDKLPEVEEVIRGKANDLVYLAKTNGVVGLGLRGEDIFRADGLLLGILDELKSLGVNVSEYATEEQIAYLKSGNK